jgi:hypothetical protein
MIDPIRWIQNMQRDLPPELPDALVVITPDVDEAIELNVRVGGEGEGRRIFAISAARGVEFVEMLERPVAAILLTRGVPSDIRARFVGDGWVDQTIYARPSRDVHPVLAREIRALVVARHGKPGGLLFDASDDHRVVIWEMKPSAEAVEQPKANAALTSDMFENHDRLIRGEHAPPSFLSGDDLDRAAQAYGVPTRAQSIRAENLRIANEVAKNPPGWAYPLAWTLAVSAAVEHMNNRPDPRSSIVGVSCDGAVGLVRAIEPALRRYHEARLDGTTPERAREKSGPCGSAPLPDMLCAAYERGRPGPNAPRLGRPA